MNSENIISICKAMGDTNRLKIIEMLSDGEKCGCELLAEFNITQPTLSHHMKVLYECGLIFDRQEGKWHHYSLNIDVWKAFNEFVNHLYKGR